MHTCLCGSVDLCTHVCKHTCVCLSVVGQSFHQASLDLKAPQRPIPRRHRARTAKCLRVAPGVRVREREHARKCL